MVEAAPGGRLARAGAADGQAEAPGAVGQGRGAGRAAARGVDEGAAGAVQAGGGDAVHVVAGEPPGVVVAAQRAAGRGGGHPHRGAHAARGGGAHRVLRQHAGVARGCGRQRVLQVVAGTRASGVHGGVPASGRALRATGGCAAAGAGLEPLAVVPGAARAPERAAAGATVGAGVARRGLRAGRREVRPHALRARDAGGLGRAVGIQHGAVRRGDGPRARQPPCGAAEGSAGGPGAQGGSGGPPGCGGAAEGVGGVAVAGGGAAPVVVDASTGGGAGGAHALGHGGDEWRRLADVRATGAAGQSARAPLDGAGGSPGERGGAVPGAKQPRPSGGGAGDVEDRCGVPSVGPWLSAVATGADAR